MNHDSTLPRTVLNCKKKTQRRFHISRLRAVNRGEREGATKKRNNPHVDASIYFGPAELVSTGLEITSEMMLYLVVYLAP